MLPKWVLLGIVDHYLRRNNAMSVFLILKNRLVNTKRECCVNEICMNEEERVFVEFTEE